ncbi:MAG TPA: phosphodiesterase YaeI [Bryobacteraceae bacterium]|nr:phosphodiesterase YaeI [Bryobacteraceae bacterium]
MNRRYFLYGLPTAALSAFGYVTLIEPRWLAETWKTVRTGRNLRRPLRIAHLSDLHASYTVPISFLETAFRQALAMQPDMVCLTGDYVTTNADFDQKRYESALATLANSVPVYAVLGNHDGGSWAARSGWHASHVYVRNMLTRSGIHVLHNDAIRLDVQGQPLWLVGVGDWWSEELSAGLAFAKVSVPDAPVLVMSHNPDGKEDCAPYAWDLMLCGHTHGGQVMLPGYGTPMPPLVDMRYLAGLNPFENRWIHTSRGVGNISGIRMNCRPEISMLLVS